MKRRARSAKMAAACLAVVAGLGVLFAVGQAQAATTKASTNPTFLTFYGYYDNTPPSSDISYPVIHSKAGGKGTYADPITLASSTAEIKKGGKVYVPRVKKYFIMEDDCTECGQDWKGHGPNGGPKLRHLDMWLDGKGGNEMAAIDCEDALTNYNADNTPTLEPVVYDPPSNEPVDSTPLFNKSTGACYGGAQAHKTIGQYKNKSTGQCLNDPNNSKTSGTALNTAACSTAASQVFTFEGAFMSINNLCAGISGSKITLGKCTGGPSQQWSVNPGDQTISDIQTSTKCFHASGSTLTAGSCSGNAAKWTFTASTKGKGKGK